MTKRKLSKTSHWKVCLSPFKSTDQTSIIDILLTKKQLPLYPYLYPAPKNKQIQILLSKTSLTLKLANFESSFCSDSICTEECCDLPALVESTFSNRIRFLSFQSVPHPIGVTIIYPDSKPTDFFVWISGICMFISIFISISIYCTDFIFHSGKSLGYNNLSNV